MYLVAASTRGTAWHIVNCAVFAITLVLVYLCSTLYHSLVRTRARHVFQVLDHSAIYLLIAGTYTPFTLVSLRGPVGWALFGVVWALAVAGVIFKSLAVGRFAVASVLVYLFQGWFVVFAALPLLQAIGWHGIMRLVAGDWLTRWASLSLLWTACATSTPPGMSSSWPAAWPTTLPFFSTSFRSVPEPIAKKGNVLIDPLHNFPRARGGLWPIRQFLLGTRILRWCERVQVEATSPF
jgi:hemolysin III